MPPRCCGEGALLIDTLEYAKRLEEAGFTRDQARAAAEALADGRITNLVAKSDLEKFITDLRSEIAVRTDLEEGKGTLRTAIA